MGLLVHSRCARHRRGRGLAVGYGRVFGKQTSPKQALSPTLSPKAGDKDGAPGCYPVAATGLQAISHLNPGLPSSVVTAKPPLLHPPGRKSGRSAGTPAARRL